MTAWPFSAIRHNQSQGAAAAQKAVIPQATLPMKRWTERGQYCSSTQPNFHFRLSVNGREYSLDVNPFQEKLNTNVAVHKSGYQSQAGVIPGRRWQIHNQLRKT